MVPALGNLVTEVNCAITTPSGTTTYSDPTSCPGGLISASPPYDLFVNLTPGDGISGHQIDYPNYKTSISFHAAFTDAFEIIGVPSGTIQWAGELDVRNPGSTPSWSSTDTIDGSFWPSFGHPIVTSFTAGQDIPISILLNATGQCCIDGGDYAYWQWMLSQITVYDGNGQLVTNPQYASADGYAYPVVGGVEVAYVPEPGTWVLTALGFCMIAFSWRTRTSPCDADPI